jgi:hypothetical protein
MHVYQRLRLNRLTDRAVFRREPGMMAAPAMGSCVAMRGDAVVVGGLLSVV